LGYGAERSVAVNKLLVANTRRSLYGDEDEDEGCEHKQVRRGRWSA